MIPYIETFYTQWEADALFTFLQSHLVGVREKNKRNANTLIRKLHYGTYLELAGSGVPHLASQAQASYGVPLDLATAPDEIKKLADRLTAFAGKTVNYLSVLGYADEHDHINFHQHKEDKKQEDQSVYVFSLGQVRELALRPIGCKDKTQYEYLYPVHGSLYVLPSSYNTTHEHAILDQGFPCSLRISINCKSIPKPHKYGPLYRDKDDTIYRPVQPENREFGAWTHPTLGLKVWCARKGYWHPDEAVYVGRAVSRGETMYPKTPWGNHLRITDEESFRKSAAAVLRASGNPKLFLEPLVGRDLLCWCVPSEPWCHARVWLELANGLTTNAEVVTPEPESPEQEPPKRKKAQAASCTKIPTFGYPGGKARLAKRIAAMLTSGHRFVEPFAGRGNVYFYVAAHGMYRSYWLNDIRTAPFLFTLRIGHILSVPKPGKESLYKYRAVSRDKTKSPLARNHALLLEPYLCWNGGVYGQSGGTRRGTQVGYCNKIRLASEILRSTDTRISRLDYRDVLARCGPDDIVYLDPPYINANVKAYSDKTLNHLEMVEILKNAKFKWVLSEYEQPLYIEAFGKPVLRISVKCGTGKSGGGSKGKKMAVECVWTNVPLAFDFEYIEAEESCDVVTYCSRWHADDQGVVQPWARPTSHTETSRL